MTKKGIDISQWNGVVDFKKLKNSIDFVIIRCGYGKDGKDGWFETNVAGCETNNIPWGVYHYSYALTKADAIAEAQFVLKQLKGRGQASPDYPVFFDMEDADGYKQKNGMPSKTELTDMCIAFCEVIKAAGYTPGIYASRSWFESTLDDSRLKGYDHWVADWGLSKSKYTGAYTLWQYTSAGTVSGVSGNVDMNVAYKDYAAVKEVTNNMENSASPWAKDAVNWAVEKGLIQGDSAGNLKLRDSLTREEFCVILKRYDNLR